ncbi:MAG: tannase/feruloyl esterase family alpha/beta hydrolase [Caulobacteraceae bacterium]
MPAGQASGCITDAQVAALNRLYNEAKGSDGLVYAYPYSRGSEPGWPTFQNTVADPQRAATDRDLGLRAIMFGDPDFKFADFVLERDGPKARAGAFAKYYEADDPNLKPFLAKGRLILWHGLDDQGPSPWGTVAYNARMRAATGDAAAANRPPVPGARRAALRRRPGPSQIDWLAPMDSWIKTGTAPASITASTPPAPPARPGAPAPQPVKMVTRPLCPYPAQARWDGKGDTSVEASFACR